MLNVRSKEDIEFCTQMFTCPSVDLTVAKRKVKFLTKYFIMETRCVLYLETELAVNWIRLVLTLLHIN